MMDKDDPVKSPPRHIMVNQYLYLQWSSSKVNLDKVHFKQFIQINQKQNRTYLSLLNVELQLFKKNWLIYSILYRQFYYFMFYR